MRAMFGVLMEFVEFRASHSFEDVTDSSECKQGLGLC